MSYPPPLGASVPDPHVTPARTLELDFGWSNQIAGFRLSRSNSRVTVTQTPPPGYDTMRSSRITRSLGPRPSRDSRTKEGLGTLVDFLGSIWDGPIRLQDFACHAIVTFKLTCDGYQTPPPGHDTMRSFAITRSLLKCACA